MIKLIHLCMQNWNFLLNPGLLKLCFNSYSISDANNSLEILDSSNKYMKSQNLKTAFNSVSRLRKFWGFWYFTEHFSK